MLITNWELKAQINFTYHSSYKFLKGNAASGLSANWMASSFNDASWTSSPAPFRYGDGVGGTLLDSGLYSSFYLRTTFNASNIAAIQNIVFTVDYDDGFVIWVNGQEALSRNAPASRAFNSFATANHESGTGEVISLLKSAVNLIQGSNTIAVQCFNVSLSSSDFYFDMGINSVSSTPELIDTIGVDFNVPSGFYSSPFNLTLTSPDATAQVIYTLDGSNPQTSATSYKGGSTITFSIDPASTTGRAKTPAVVVRSCITKAGYNPSKPKSQTYIFNESVKHQSYPGGAWPNSSVNGQILYYNMDSIVTKDSRYKDKIGDALLAIPTISIVTDMANLFDPASGIYVNASGHGLDWEKECSAELINPDGSAGFNIEAGLRIRGGWSRHPEFPKHAFRLFFRSEYGKSKLDFPLFGDEGVSEFDKIDLRCEQNYAWSQGDSRNTCVRDVFSRDTQRDMGQPYTRSRYYHLYLNGMYWGLYQTEERAEANFGSEYLNGNKDNYDAIKVSTDNWTYQIEATDGSLDSWQNLWNKCSSGFADNASYYNLSGKDSTGKPNGTEIKVNIDNLIDYMLVVFYTGNFDSPTSSFGSNKGCNNFCALDDTSNKSDGFTFYVHDAEHCLFSEAGSPGIGLNEDRVNIGTRTDGMKMEAGSFDVFHPQWLHYKLSANAEYRMRFADRAYRLLTGQGALTPSAVRSRLDKRVAEIETAIIAESARWGGTAPWSGVPYTKDDNWLPEINKIRNDYFPYRTNIVINQLKTANLYSSLIPPVIKNGSSVIGVDKYTFNSAFNANISNPNSSGNVYYTMDGTDPRLVGGGISSTAVKLDASASISISSSTIINSRVYSDGNWSALNHIDVLNQSEDYSQLKITELNYHPLDLIIGNDTTSGQDFEFIEFKNIGETAISLAGLTIDSAVTYSFPDDAILAPQKFYVVASKPSRFYDRYGLIASGNYRGHFSNSGEYVLLANASGNPVISFTYDDNTPWPEKADGDGYTMVSYIFNPTEKSPDDPSYWISSKLINGSPFKDDDGITDVETHLATGVEGNLLVYPNPSSQSIVLHLSTDVIGLIGIKLYNINGILIYQANIGNNSKINLKEIGLDAGMYIIQVKTNELLETAKIIYSPN